MLAVRAGSVKVRSDPEETPAIGQPHCAHTGTSAFGVNIAPPNAERRKLGASRQAAIANAVRQLSAGHSRKPPEHFVEEFRAPEGARKSDMYEPAISGR
jgi:hypothetical protein